MEIRKLSNTCKPVAAPIRRCLIMLFFTLSLLACKNRKHIGERNEAAKPAEINELAIPTIEETLKDALENNGHLNDSFSIKYAPVVQYLYARNSNAPLWTQNGKYLAPADSLFSFINHARYYGLFPEDYYQPRLTILHNKLASDTATNENKLDVSLWAETDMLFTSAFVELVRDLKVGRLSKDTISVASDASLTTEFFAEQLKALQQTANSDQFAAALEPKHLGYIALKEALGNYLQDTLSDYNHISVEEGTNLLHLLQQRLNEEGDDFSASDLYDSVRLSKTIKRYQELKGLNVDGVVSEELLDILNLSKQDKFIRIAITLDRYKQLPSTMPRQYIWVNIPGFYLQVWEDNAVELESKIIVGKPQTHTPQLTSAITNMVTYPQWHVPASIIAKEMLPALKKDPGYLSARRLSLIDKDGNDIDPYTVNWNQYEKRIPYNIVQGSGDDNALGILKFNFNNKYAVYLHDTNQRQFFNKINRALSHGCVRVEQWEPLAYYILENDNKLTDKATPIDSLQTWLAMGEKRVIPVHKRIPLYIRYFTCEGKDGSLRFFDDIYGLDDELRKIFFANK